MSDPGEMIELLAEYSDDPYGFVLTFFPWGEGELRDKEGPDAWQRQILDWIAEGLLTPDEAIQLAVSSGHGVGKSALVAWIILWAMSTEVDTRGVVTANTENQLKTKTWVELAKWFRLFLGRDLFYMTATALFSRDREHSTTWRIDMVPWSERNTEAFAGLHNEGRRILVVFDEASAIPDLIHETTEGALTDDNTQIIWCMFGNPTRNSGRFFESFGERKFAKAWRTMKVDSRSVAITNKAQIQKWAETYGEDSDFFRVRVKGEFPRVDAQAFISFELARDAADREVSGAGTWVLGVDVARFGDDASVIYYRRGRDGASRPPSIYYGISTMQLAAHVANAAMELHATSVFVDGGGVGGGVVDRLRQLNCPVWEVQFGAKPDMITEEPGTTYGNKRSEIWGAMREWLRAGGSIPAEIPGYERDFVQELSAPTYTFNNKDAIMLESKNDMKRRGEPSPDVADALACTFAFPVYEPAHGEEPETVTEYDDYNPYEEYAA